MKNFLSFNSKVFMLFLSSILFFYLHSQLSGQVLTSDVLMEQAFFEYDIENNFKVNQSRPDYSLGIFGIMLNPTGLLQFGPIAQLEFYVSSKTLIAPHIRFSGLGILSKNRHGYDKISNNSMAIGIALKKFRGSISKNKYFVGIITEYGWGRGSSKLDEKYQHKFISLFPNIGYRWRFSSGLFINLGGIAGFSLEIEDKKTSPFSKTLENDVLFIYMLDLSFGFEFKD